MKMPKIAVCTIRDSAYNRKDECHAGAINIGGDIPCCDTMTDGMRKGGTTEIGRVGACKVEKCGYDQALECMAKSIRVGTGSCDAECLTFENR